MVKLLKHELLAILRILGFIAAAAVVFAVIGRILFAVEFSGSGGMLQDVLATLFVTFYMFAIIALVFAAWGIGVSRFYKTLFTGEGYMTLSLPVSPTGIIWAKLLSSVIATFLASIVSILTATIFFIGMDAEVIGLIGEGIGDLLLLMQSSFLTEPLLSFEAILLFIFSVPASLLAVYACISAGQLFTTHRRLMTFLFIVGGYMLLQMFSLFCLTPIYAAAASVSGHLTMWIMIVLIAAADVGCFLFIRYILKNKVNLVL